MDNQELRARVKMLKATGQIENYIEVANALNLKPKSLYNYLRGDYNLSSKNKQILTEYIQDLWLPIEYQ